MATTLTFAFFLLSVILTILSIGFFIRAFLGSDGLDYSKSRLKVWPRIKRYIQLK